MVVKGGSAEIFPGIPLFWAVAPVMIMHFVRFGGVSASGRVWVEGRLAWSVMTRKWRSDVNLVRYNPVLGRGSR